MNDIKNISKNSKNIIDFSTKYFERLSQIFSSIDKKN